MKPLTTALIVRCGASPAYAGLYTNALNEHLPKEGINTYNRLCHFLSQTLHESIGYSRTVENLNYSAEALMRTWKTRFPDLAFAKRYARQPVRIGNLAYANRLGNGPVESGEGYRYRGRGLIQITGKDKYIALSKLYHKDYVNHPELVELPEGALLSALWYWRVEKLNLIADTDDVRRVTRGVNGGEIGLLDRTQLLAKAKVALLPLFN